MIGVGDPLDGTPEELAELAGRLFGMARAGDARRLAAYLDAGVPVNLANANGDTLLMLAAYHGHPTTAQVLIERGADVDRTNARGQTPSPASGWCPQAGAVFRARTTWCGCFSGRVPTRGQVSRRRSTPRRCSASPATWRCSAAIRKSRVAA